MILYENISRFNSMTADNRNEPRFLISAYMKRSARHEEPHFSMGSAETIRGEINDISMRGLGFRIRGISDTETRKLLAGGTHIITIHLHRKLIQAEAAIVWCINLRTDESHLALGGMKIISLRWREKIKWRGALRKVKRLSRR